MLVALLIVQSLSLVALLSLGGVVRGILTLLAVGAPRRTPPVDWDAMFEQGGGGS